MAEVQGKLIMFVNWCRYCMFSEWSPQNTPTLLLIDGKYICIYTYTALAIMPSHQQKMHVFAYGCKSMNVIFKKLHLQCVPCTSRTSFSKCLAQALIHTHTYTYIYIYIYMSTNNCLQIPYTRMWQAESLLKKEMQYRLFLILQTHWPESQK